MAAHPPHGGRRGARSRAARGGAAIVLAAAVAATLPPSAAAGAPALPSNPRAAVPADPQEELAKLKKRAKKLSKEYRGELISLKEAEKAADRAKKDADRLTGEHEKLRADMSRLAATSYMSGRLDSLPLVTSGDPAAVRDATIIEMVARNNNRRVEDLQSLAARAAQSRKTAEEKVKAVRKEIKKLESQRDRVRKLLAKHAPEPSPSGGGSSGRPDGASGTKSPITGNSMTARMRKVLVEVDGKFGPFPAIGCMRPGDPQDHGSGRACDFMESTGGQMPSASARAHGDSVAQYVINNASRLGIKYVIWRQRIYDMRSSGGWSAMGDRGSITANHYDHVHISVL